MTTYSLDFARARKRLDELKQHLTSEEALDADHDDIEQHIHTHGQEILRLMLQGHLHYRAASEVAEPITGVDGQTRATPRDSSRRLLSLFGKVTVLRLSLVDRDLPGGLRPLDAELNLPADSYSFGLRRRVIDEVVRGSYDDLVQRISDTTAAHVPKRQAENLVLAAAQDFQGFYDTRDFQSADPEDVLVLSFDGKGVVMLTRDLREATRKKAEQSKPKLDHRVSPGEKPNRKRMAQVATVYEVSVQVREPADIIGPAEAVEERARRRKKRPRTKNKRVWASLVEDPLKVIDDAFHEALLRDPQFQRRWVVLVDGCGHQLRRIRRVASSYGVEVFIVLDIIHVVEKLWKAAWCLFEKGDPAADAWVSTRLLRMLEGRVSGVAGGMRRSATLRELTATQREKLDDCASFLVKHKALLDYAEALACGYPIATGVIEGACRHLVQDRMGITGARWSLKGGEAVLRLRALYASGDLQEYRVFHKQRELERNHLRHFADHELQHLRRVA